MTSEEAPDRLAEGLARFLADWRAARIRCLALRGYEDLPSSVRNDLDVLVERDCARELERLLMQATSTSGLRRFARIERSAGSPVAHRFFDRTSPRNLGIDVFTDLHWRGIPFLDVSEVLADRVSHDPIDVPRPAHEAAASLFGKVLQGVWVRRDRRERIRELAHSDAMEFMRVAEQAFGTEAAGRLLDRVRNLSLGPDPSETRRLRLALIRHAGGRAPLRSLGGFGRDARRVCERVWRPTGVFVVLLGPDGSGKSSLAGPLADRLAGRLGGVKGSTFHWKPARVLDRGGTAPVSEPHGRSPRGRFVSLLYLLFHWMEFAGGFWSVIRPLLIRGMPVVGERYYFDVWLDPLRYRLDLPSRIGARGTRGILSPDVTLCLLTDAETLHTRKQEVSLTATREQLAAVEAFASGEESARLINAALSFEDVLDTCERVVLDWLADRDARRSRRLSRRPL